eukprot:639961-Pyramimonas_sp.AAC.1
MYGCHGRRDIVAASCKQSLWQPSFCSCPQRCGAALPQCPRQHGMHAMTRQRDGVVAGPDSAAMC